MAEVQHEWTLGQVGELAVSVAYIINEGGIKSSRDQLMVDAARDFFSCANAGLKRVLDNSPFDNAASEMAYRVVFALVNGTSVMAKPVSISLQVLEHLSKAKGVEKFDSLKVDRTDMFLMRLAWAANSSDK